MGFWLERQYEDFVRAHADSPQRTALLLPSSELFDPAYPNIFAGYDPMPKWMKLSNLITLDNGDKPFTRENEVHFRLLLHAYRTDKAKHISDVKSRLRQIKERRTGLALLTEINATNKTLMVMPYHGSEINADSGAQKEGDMVDGTARDRRVNYDYGDTRYGTGLGTDSRIRFTPGMFAGSVMADEGFAPDEVLFHEMVHSSRIMRGVLDSFPVNAGYDDKEEYLAIVLTNIYLSEKGQRAFRASHGNWPDEGNFEVVPRGANAVLKGADANNFLRNVQHVDMPPVTLMENFRSTQRVFYNALAHLPPDHPKYNWVRDYDLDRPFLLQKQQGGFTL